MSDTCLILLVEDNEDDAFFVKRALKELGFRGILRHFTATDEARQYVSGEGQFSNRTNFPLPQIIISDSALSDRESGVEFLEWVRRHKLCAEVPFILMSGEIADDTRKRAEKAGVKRILTKAPSA